MKTLTILLLLFSAASFASLDTLNKTVSYSYYRGLVKGFCTGSYVNIDNQTYFATAAHCFSKNLRKKKIKTYKRTSQSKKINSSKATIVVKRSHNFSLIGDRVLSPVSFVNPGVEVMEHAKGLPYVGEEVYALGFPKASKNRWISKFKCEYLGSAKYFSERTPDSLGRVLKCYTNLSSISGMSGGPIVNGSGEFVGVISSQIHPKSTRPFPGGKRYIYVIFNEVYNGEILSNDTEREVDYFLKYKKDDFAFYQGEYTP